MTRQRHRTTGPRDYPTSLNGGEGRESPEHRIGETERQSPQIDKPDPGSARQPDVEREKPEPDETRNQPRDER